MMTDLSAAAGRAAKGSSEMPMDDVALVEALRSGDQQAPRLLIERYQGVVFGLCYRMMNHQQDAEDVVQETFIRALRAMAGFDSARPIVSLAPGDRRQPLPHGTGPPRPQADAGAGRPGL